MNEKKSDKIKYENISLPRCLIEDVQEIIDELGYWIDLDEFVRVAVLEKLRKERESPGKTIPVPILPSESKDGDDDNIQS